MNLNVTEPRKVESAKELDREMHAKRKDCRTRDWLYGNMLKYDKNA